MTTNLSFDSYDGLKNVVAAYLQRANLVSMIPLFIRQAEDRLTNNLITLPQQVALPYSLVPSAGTSVIELPSDFGALIRATYMNVPLAYIPPQAIDIHQTAQRSFEFSIIGSKFYLQTHSDGGAVLTLYYYSQLQGLSDANESNWLLEDYPSVYLYATLLEATPYIGDDARIPLWQQALATGVADINNAARMANTPQKTRLTRTLR